MTRTELPARRVCIVLLSGIGDVVNGLPLANALKRDDPDRRITWIVESGPAPVLDSHPAIDTVLTFDRRKGLREVWSLWRRLRPHSFDLVLNLNIYFKSAIPTFLARAPHTVAFGPGLARDLVWLFANHRVPSGRDRHRVDQHIDVLGYLGIEPPAIEWRLAITEQERVAKAEFFRPLDGRRVAGLVPTAGREAKDWPPNRWAELADTLERRFGFRVVLLGGPSARERERAEIVQRATGDTVISALGPDLRRLVYLIDGCDLVIAPDTGPLHIARALETPVIGLFGHTDPRTVGPYRAYDDLLVDRRNFDAPGIPVDPDETDFGDRMHLVRVEDVLERVERALETYLAGASSV